jgi:hypothetical protein
MNIKNIVVSGSLAGILILILMVVINVLVNVIIPTDLSRYGGMRGSDDPVMILFFFYPFVVAFAAAILFDTVRFCLTGTSFEKGLMFGALLLTIMTIPSLYVMITSMTWPIDFYVSTALWEFISFPAMGILFTKIWNVT